MKFNKKVKAFFQGTAWKKVLTFLFFLSLSFGFWILQTLQQTFEKRILLPIHYQNIPSQIVLDNDIPSNILIRIKGKGTLLLKYTLGLKKQDDLEIDLKDIDLKKSSYTISKTDLESMIYKRLFSAVSLISCTPDMLHITYQPLEKKEVPIVLSGKLTPDAGYFLIDTVFFTPSKVSVYGAKTFVDSLSAIYTENISIKNIQKNIRRQVELVVPEGIKLDRTSVELNVSAEEYTEKVIQVPVECKHLPKNYKIHIFPPTVEVISLVSLVNYGKITKNDFEVSIDYFDLLKSSNYTTSVNLTKTPDCINNCRIKPEKVEFLLEERE